MAIYSILSKAGIVENRVDASSDAPLDMFFPGQEIIEETEQTGPGFIGYAFLPEVQKFQTARPFASWSWSAELLDWVAPIAYPEDGALYLWDEANLSWIEVTDGSD